MTQTITVSSITLQVSQGGRIVIPVEMRQKMGIRAGDQVLISWSEESHEFRVATHKQRLHQARELVKRYVDTDGSVVDELIQERRQATVSAVYGEVLAFHIAIITSMDMTIES